MEVFSFAVMLFRFNTIRRMRSVVNLPPQINSHGLKPFQITRIVTVWTDCLTGAAGSSKPTDSSRLIPMRNRGGAFTYSQFLASYINSCISLIRGETARLAMQSNFIWRMGHEDHEKCCSSVWHLSIYRHVFSKNSHSHHSITLLSSKIQYIPSCMGHAYTFSNTFIVQEGKHNWN